LSTKHTHVTRQYS